MAVDLHTLKEDIAVSSRVTIHSVTTEEMLHQWARVWGCGAPDEVTSMVFTVFAAFYADAGSSLRFYLGTLDGKSVATVALFFGAGVASIEHVVTLPEVRGQGIGAAMTLMAAREARREGYRIGTLTASPMGINIYRRLGFREYGTFSTYAWDPSSQGTSH